MAIALHSVFRDLDRSEALEAAIARHVDKLERFSEHIMRCQVRLETVGKHQQQGRLYEVRVDLTLPGTQVAISHEHRHEDIFVALRDAFEATTRKVQEYVRTQRGDVKSRNVAPDGQ